MRPEGMAGNRAVVPACRNEVIGDRGGRVVRAAGGGVRSPNREQPGSINSAMVSWADITPTLLDFALVVGADV